MAPARSRVLVRMMALLTSWFESTVKVRAGIGAPLGAKDPSR